jgi:hypothetical protein
MAGPVAQAQPSLLLTSLWEGCSLVKQNATPDSSFWINAYRSGLLPFVFDRFTLFYAPAVGAELKEGFPSGKEFWRFARMGMLKEARPQVEALRDHAPAKGGPSAWRSRILSGCC